MADHEETGYGQPPVKSRWKKGQSGNPKGRPKSRPEILKDAAAILAEPVTAQTPTGRQVTLEAVEAAYLAVCREGLKGHKPSLLYAIKLMLDVNVAAEKTKEIEEERRRILEDLNAKFRRNRHVDPGD